MNKKNNNIHKIIHKIISEMVTKTSKVESLYINYTYTQNKTKEIKYVLTKLVNQS